MDSEMGTGCNHSWRPRWTRKQQELGETPDPVPKTVSALTAIHCYPVNLGFVSLWYSRLENTTKFALLLSSLIINFG